MNPYPIPPKELGLNEEQRQAKLVELTAKEMKALRETQAWERAKRLEYELAQDDVRRIGALLQFMAMTTVPQTDHQEALIEF